MIDRMPKPAGHTTWAWVWLSYFFNYLGGQKKVELRAKGGRGGYSRHLKEIVLAGAALTVPVNISSSTDRKLLL